MCVLISLVVGVLVLVGLGVCVVIRSFCWERNEKVGVICVCWVMWWFGVFS